MDVISVPLQVSDVKAFAANIQEVAFAVSCPTLDCNTF